MKEQAPQTKLFFLGARKSLNEPRIGAQGGAGAAGTRAEANLAFMGLENGAHARASTFGGKAPLAAGYRSQSANDVF